MGKPQGTEDMPLNWHIRQKIKDIAEEMQGCCERDYNDSEFHFALIMLDVRLHEHIEALDPEWQIGIIDGK